ncbi:MAG TPA: hypothetical protein VHG72_13625 [Polyangia bacterium]|nr:hypothetical protein [Polyangia bacterium]
MRHLRTFLWMSALAIAVPAVASADENQPQILDTSAGARSGAERVGGVTMTAPAHASTAVGQSPEALSTDDTRREHPRNPAVVGPPVPAKAAPAPASADQPATNR